MTDEPKRPDSPRDTAGWSERERVAHDVRTQVTVIKVRAQLLRRRLRKGTLGAPDLDAALHHIELATVRLERAIHYWERNQPDPTDAVTP